MEKTSKMAQRYGAFENVEELKQFYIDSFISLQRALKKNGLLIVKFQDFVNGRRNYFMIDYVFQLARDFNFKVLDLFILLSKTRPTKIKTQQHARKYHSYFIVLRNSTKHVLNVTRELGEDATILKNQTCMFEV